MMADLSRFTWGKGRKKDEPEKGGEMGAGGNLNSILEEMAGQVDGVLCIAVAGSDGVAMSSYVPSGSMLNAELAAAQLAAIFRISRTSADKLKAGDLEDNLLTSTAGQILIRPLGQESYLAIVTTKDAPLGIVRLVIKSYASRVEHALGRV
jgi:predicted regulator of Ras-like GTPase activity (Roadblock/LC7/MglB family)